MEYVADYGSHSATVGLMRRQQYKSREFKNTLRMLQSSTGCIVEGSLRRSLELQGFSFDDRVDNKSVYEPNALWSRLAKYEDSLKTSINPTVASRAEALTWKQFANTSGLLQSLNTIDEFYSSIKGNKASGAPHFGSKADTFDRDFKLHSRIVLNDKAPPPCVAYHRIQHGESGPKTRLVWGYPSCMTLVEAKFARPLISHFLRVDGPMTIGLHRHQLSAKMTAIQNSGVWYGLDFSGFDSSVNEGLIRFAFRILRTYFEKSDINDAYWRKIIHYFINTTIIMPDGFIYQKRRGIPSGSYFTQLVGSIINYYAIQYVSCSLGSAILPGKILVLGDDSLFGWNKHEDLVRIAGLVRELGLTMNVEKSACGRHEDPVVYLGHDWYRGIPTRDEIDVAKRIVFPETPNNIRDPELRLVTRMMSYAAESPAGWKLLFKWSRYKSRYLPGMLNRPLHESSVGTQRFRVEQMSDENTSTGVNGQNLVYSGLII